MLEAQLVGMNECVCIWIRVRCILYNILRPQLDDQDIQAYMQLNVINENGQDEVGLWVEPSDIAKVKRIALYNVIFNEEMF